MARPFTFDRDELDRWCQQHLGAAPAAEIFRAGYLSTVVGLRLDDCREVVVKIRPSSPRLAGCVQVQRHLSKAGFPCPQPLTALLPFGDRMATAEAHVPGGQSLPASGREAEPFAAGLARLVRLAPSTADVPDLDPAPPWTAWAHREPRLWPWPDDHDGDLNLVGGPNWIDEAGRRARQRLAAARPSPRLVGHGDWYTGNLRWQEDDLFVVHDWDSVIADSEPAIVGFAAAVYPAVHAGSEATIDETDAFIDAYCAARSTRFDRDDLECCWAAGLWIRAYDAKKQVAKGEAVRSLTESGARDLFARAGCQ